MTKRITISLKLETMKKLRSIKMELLGVQTEPSNNKNIKIYPNINHELSVIHCYTMLLHFAGKIELIKPPVPKVIINMLCDFYLKADKGKKSEYFKKHKSRYNKYGRFSYNDTVFFLVPRLINH